MYSIVKSLDDLGRIVLPMEIRRTLKLKKNEELSISFDGEEIKIKRKKESCVFCGKFENLKKLNQKPVCKNCQDKLFVLILDDN